MLVGGGWREIKAQGIGYSFCRVWYLGIGAELMEYSKWYFFYLIFSSWGAGGSFCLLS